MDNLRKWRAIAIEKFVPLPDMPDSRKRLLPDILELISDETLTKVKELLPYEYIPEFCHGDFNSGNVLYQADSI